ncbi:MAG: hypothetical protein QXQ51_00370 [Desulfurococcaceae archaeon]
MMTVNRSSAWKIAAALNRGGKVTGLCEEMDCISVQTMYRLVHRLLVNGVLSKHVVVPLEALPVKVSTAILARQQKTAKPCLKKPLHLVVQYYSYAGNPVEIYYALEDCTVIEDGVDPFTCRLEFCERVVETVIPVEGREDHVLELVPYSSPQSISNRRLDEFDVAIALDIFRLSNPPFKYSWKTKDLVEVVEKRLGIRNVRYHYYEHLHKMLLLRYTTRNGGSFLVMLIHAPTPQELKRVLNILIETKFIEGIWQIHYFSKAPLIALIYAWGHVDKFVEPEYVHEGVDNTSYTTYPILGVYHGMPKA